MYTRSVLSEVVGSVATAIAMLAAVQAFAAPGEQIDVLCRDGWKARPARPGLVMHQIDRLTVHHSGTIFRDNRRAPGTVRRFQAYHQGKGYADIAYHYVIDAAGNIYQGRDPAFKGDTPTDYDPSGHLLICLAGNFEVQEPSSSQMDALVALLAWASAQYQVPTDRIAGHRDHAHTLCPGRRLHERLLSGEIRRKVDERLRTGPVQVHLLCGEPAQERVRRIEAGTSLSTQ
jgi:hypothetical protein